MDKDKISTKQTIGPFILKPGESKEFTVGIPIPKGITSEEVFKMIKKGEIVVTGTYQDEDGKEYHFKERLKCGDNRKINKISIINLVVGIILLIAAVYYISIGIVILAPILIFLAIVNLYCIYKYGIWKKND